MACRELVSIDSTNAVSILYPLMNMVSIYDNSYIAIINNTCYLLPLQSMIFCITLTPTKLLYFPQKPCTAIHKVLNLNEKEVMWLQFHSPVFPLCLSCYLAEFVPLLFHKSGMELIFSSGKQFIDKFFVITVSSYSQKEQ